jgi:deoxyribodipyrimidine photolyase-related protein
MYTTLYILPNQLFATSILKQQSFKTIVLWEHPHFFTKYKYNKKKLLLHRASMKSYFDVLSKEFKDVKFIEFHESHKVNDDSIVYDTITEISDFKKCTQLESPNFFLSKTDFQDIYNNKKGKDSIRFTTYFYPRAKHIINVLVNTNSKDHENRKTFKKGELDVPSLPSIKESSYISEAQTYVEKHFKTHYGNVNDFHYPITHKDAKRWLISFCEKRFKHFGTYQDAIIEDEPFLFHSVLSSSINIGLLNPSDVLNEIQNYKSKVEINNYEGFVRQLLWREYQRYCYMFLRNDLQTKMKFNLSNPITKSWYSGTTGVHPIDVTIQKAFQTGYLHHIERLMIIGNFMLLNEIKPNDGFKWFMEFAIDSYEWVMYQNVYDMVFFNTGGKTTHKAYITSSKYVLRMSDYKKGDWTKIWDDLYTQFRKKYF